MTTDTETPTTDQILFDMLTENTGRHMLDSGGAYGRNWERNQGLDLATKMASPRTIVETNNWGGTAEISVTIDVFHFLRASLDYEPELDALFTEFAALPENEAEPWLPLMEAFPAWLVEHYGDEYGTRDSYTTVNSYNGEDALSQVIQYTQFSLDGHEACYGEFVALQIHGGCDVRGGYTRPRIFHTNDECSLWDNANIDAYERVDPPIDVALPGMESEPITEFYWTSDNAGYSFYDQTWSQAAGRNVGGDLHDYPLVWAESVDEVKPGQVTVLADGVVYGPHGGLMHYSSRADFV